MSAETHEFAAEARRLLDLVVHSLYRHEEIFLRELLSNAADALDKRRLEALRAGGDPDADAWKIRLETDRAARRLVVEDDGVGLSRHEAVENLGTIARSGTDEFRRALERAKGDAETLPELIGRFGVGFYSAFMVADEVVVESRRHDLPPDQGVRWSSRGDGTFSVETITREAPGTRVELKLRAPGGEEGEARPDYTDPALLSGLVRRFSNYVPWPIEMEGEVLNERVPLWTRPPSEVKDEEYRAFGRTLLHEEEDPLLWVHVRAEGTQEYTALLYVPARRPLDLFDPDRIRSRLALYVRRVLVDPEFDALLPPFLRFVRGVVDSQDLPLNVSRETLQHTRRLEPMRRRLTARLLERLQKLLEEDRAAYERLWERFGPVIKEGMAGDDDELRFRIAALSLFRTSRRDGLATLDEYVEKMPFAQKEILWIAGDDEEALRRSPHLEAAARRGFEVLLLTDPVDEFAFARLVEFDGRPVRPIDRGEVDLCGEEDQAERRRAEGALEGLPEAVAAALGEHVDEVRFSKRLTDSPAVLVEAAGAPSPRLRAALQAMGRPVPETRPVLELHPGHPVTKRLERLRREDETRFRDACELLLGQALLAVGRPPPDPARFSRLLADLLAGGAGVSDSEPAAS